MKRRSQPKLAVGPEPASVQAGDLPRDRKTETGARDTAGDAGCDPLKAIEDPGLIFPSDADPFDLRRPDRSAGYHPKPVA